MKSTQSKQVNKIQPYLNQPNKQSSFSFLAQCHRDKPFNTINDSFQLNKLKKSYKNKLNLHQIKIEVDSLCQQKEKDVQNQFQIIKQLKYNEDQCSYFDRIKSQKSQSFKRQLKIRSQNKKDIQTQVRQNCHSLFNDGFLPDVKKFYNTYKNFERQNERENFLRNSLSGNNSRNNSFRALKLVQNIKQQGIPPKKLGLVGNHSLDKINQNSLHLTKKQYRTLTKGLSIIDVHKVGLSNNKLARQNAKLLMRNLPQKLQKINLKNTIKSKETLSLLNSQLLKQGKLKKLNLSFNKITDTGLECIKQVFSHNLALQILNLSNNFITDESSNILGDFIKENQNLRNLNLAWNQLTSKNVFMIFKAIEISKSLLNVNLSRNKIGDRLSNIIFNDNNNIKVQNQIQNQKGCSSLKSLCNMLKNNRCLLHFDLSYNVIQNKDSQQISQYFNLFNQTLVGFHYLGNSNYSQNQFGFLVQNQKTLSDTQSSEKYLLSNYEIKRIQKINFSPYSNATTQKCWICQGWITKKFTFQIDRKTVQIKQAFKNLFSNQSIQNEMIKNVYIHLECYNYQPVLMKCKKKIKSGIINKILQGQSSMKNFGIQNEKNKTSNNRKFEKQQKQKIKLSSKTSKNFNSLLKNQNSLKEDQEIIIYSYSINLKIPSNKKIKYFFTIDGQPFTDSKTQIQKLNNRQVQVQFIIFNPFQDLLFKKLQEIKRQDNNKLKQIINQKIQQVLQLFQSLIGEQKSHNKLPVHLKLFVSEFNLHIPDRQPYEKQQRTYLQKYLLQKVYKKLLSDDQQLTEQQYNALIKQRVKFQKIKNQGSDKYISSDKLIQTKQLQHYEEESQESPFYIKPRFKDLFYGWSDPKLNVFEIGQFFKVFFSYSNDQKNQKLFQQLEKYIKKGNQQLKQLKTKILYPYNSSINTQNDYLNMIHFQKLINKEKIKIDSLTGKILKIGNFRNLSLEDSQNKSKLQSKNRQEDDLIEQQLKIKISQILPYALIFYHNSRKQNNDQNSIKNLSGIFNKLEQKSKRKTSSRNKRTKSKLFKTKNQKYKKSQQLTTQAINLSGYQKIKLQQQILDMNQTQQEKKLSQENQNEEQKSLCLDQLNQEQMINLISIRLVQEIFQYNKEESQKIVSIKKDQKISQEKNTLNMFVKKLQAWKDKQTCFTNQENQILSLIGQQIRKLLQEKVNKIEEAHKLMTQKPNKFNIKINKFCSLESSTPQSLNFQSTLNKLTPKKRPTVDLKDKSFKFFNEEFQYPFQKQKESLNGKNNIDPKNVDSLNILENIQLFYLYDKLFNDLFIESSNQYTVEQCSKKINKFLGKKQRANSIKRESKTSQTQNKQRINKNLKRTIGRSSQKLQKVKTTTNSQTKNNLIQPKVQQNQQKQEESKIEKNIFMFLQKQRQESYKYFCQQQKQRFNFISIEEENPQFFINLNDYILQRFDYIILNLINNLDKIKDLKRNLSTQCKQILLKELFIFRSFLLNSNQIRFHANFQKLKEIAEQKSRNNHSLSQKFIQKMQTVNFNGIIDLLNQYLLYVCYFITKKTCFFIISDQDTLKKLCQNQNIEEKIKDSNIQKDRRQIILENEEYAEGQNLKQNQKAEKDTYEYSLVQLMKNEPKKFQQELKKFMKSVFSDIVLNITKLHIRYDDDLKKVKREKKEQQILEQTNQTPVNILPPIDEIIKIRKSSIFSHNSSKSVSKEKNKSMTSKKKKKNLLKQLTTESQLKQQTQKDSNLVIIEQKKPKTQKKKQKLSLNRVKKTKNVK